MDRLYQRTFLRNHVDTAINPPIRLEEGPRHGGVAEGDPVRDILALIDLRERSESAWLQKNQSPSDSQRKEFRQKLLPLTSPQWFFYGLADDNLYRPVTVFRADDSTRRWSELSELLSQLGKSDDHTGVLLTASSGSGKTVAFWKAFFDCMFEAPALGDDGNPQPLLKGFVPCWIRSLSSSPEIARLLKEQSAPEASVSSTVTPRLILELIGIASEMIRSADLAHLKSTRSEIDLAVKRVEDYLEYGPRLLLFFDLNHVPDDERRLIASALRSFQQTYGHRHRCIVAYRSTNAEDPTFKTLLQLGQGAFRQYDMQPLSEAVAVTYLETLREVERGLYHQLGLEAPADITGASLPESVFNSAELAIPEPWLRRIAWESRRLRELIRSNVRTTVISRPAGENTGAAPQTRSESLVSTPLLMHFVSQLRGTALQRVRNISHLYREVVELHLKREASQVSRENQISREKLIIAMVRVSLAVLKAGGSSTQLDTKRIKGLLVHPERGKHDWWLADPFFHSSQYCEEVFRAADVLSLLNHGLLQRTGESVRFLHDSFLYYFAGAVALREYMGPEDPAPGENGHSAKWCQATARVLISHPEQWTLAADFLGGAMIPPLDVDGISHPRPDHLQELDWQLTKPLILAPPHQQMPNLLIWLLRPLQDNPLMQRVLAALLADGSFIQEHPESVLQQVYNGLRWTAAPDSRQVQMAIELVSAYRQQPGEKRPWLRLATSAGRDLLPTMSAHTSGVKCVAPYIDGRIISGSDDGTVKLWNRATGEVQVIIRHNSMVWSVCAVGDQVASGSHDQTVKLWDPREAARDAEYMGRVIIRHDGPVYCVCAVGDQVASGSNDNTVKLWNPREEQRSSDYGGRVIIRHNNSLRDVCAVGDKVASGSWDCTVKLWDPRLMARDSAYLGRRIIQHNSSVTCVCAVGDQVASGSCDKTVKLWDPLEAAGNSAYWGREIIRHKNRVASVCAVGDQVASGSWDKTVKLWDPRAAAADPTYQGREILRQKNQVSIVCAVGDQVASGSGDQTVKLWDPHEASHDPEYRGRVIIRHDGWVQSVCAVGDQIASGSTDQTVKLWDPREAARDPISPERVIIRHDRSVTSVCAVGDQVASGSDDKTVKLWDPREASRNRRYMGQEIIRHTDTVRCVCAVGDQVASGSADKTVKMWDPREEQRSPKYSGRVIIRHTEAVYCVCAVGDQVASGSKDQTVQLWDPRAAAMNRRYRGREIIRHNDQVLSVCAVGDQVASRSFGRTVKLWDPRVAARNRRYKGREIIRHDSYVTSICAAGHQVVSGSDDQNVKLWDPGEAAGAPAYLGRVIISHNRSVSKVCAVGDQVASGSYDNTVKLWDSRVSAKHIHAKSFSHHRSAIKSIMAIAADLILSVETASRMVLWKTDGTVLATYDGSAQSLAVFPNFPVAIIANGSIVYLLAIEPWPDDQPEPEWFSPAAGTPFSDILRKSPESS